MQLETYVTASFVISLTDLLRTWDLNQKNCPFFRSTLEDSPFRNGHG